MLHYKLANSRERATAEPLGSLSNLNCFLLCWKIVDVIWLSPGGGGGGGVGRLYRIFLDFQ